MAFRSLVVFTTNTKYAEDRRPAAVLSKIGLIKLVVQVWSIHVKSATLSLTVAVLLAISLHANETIDVQIVSQSSSIDGSLLLQTFLPGFLIGNYDELINPQGTLTRPGLFGGTGNQPVDLDMTANLNGAIDSQPSGNYQLALDIEALSLTISDFELDVLAGQPVSLGLTLDWNFETFRTFQPDSLFLGVPFTLPLGDGTLLVLGMQQSGPADPTQLIPAGADRYTFTSLVPVWTTVESEIFGQPVSPPPIPMLLPINGQIDVSGQQIVVTHSFKQNASNEIADVPGGEYSDVPFAVPTIIPPGFTANLLLSGDVDSVSLELNLLASLVATGEFATVIAGDVNGDGQVNLLDVAPFVNAIVSGQYVQSADINCDGTVDFSDVDPFIAILVG